MDTITIIVGNFGIRRSRKGKHAAVISQFFRVFLRQFLSFRRNRRLQRRDQFILRLNFRFILRDSGFLIADIPLLCHNFRFLIGNQLRQRSLLLLHARFCFIQHFLFCIQFFLADFHVLPDQYILLQLLVVIIHYHLDIIQFIQQVGKRFCSQYRLQIIIVILLIHHLNPQLHCSILFFLFLYGCFQFSFRHPDLFLFLHDHTVQFGNLFLDLSQIIIQRNHIIFQICLFFFQFPLQRLYIRQSG